MERQTIQTNPSYIIPSKKVIPLTEVKDAIVKFLVRNGMSKSHAVEKVGMDSDTVYFYFDCANPDYTFAVAAFMMLEKFSGCPFYIEMRFTSREHCMIVHFKGETNAKIIEFIDKNRTIILESCV